MRLPDLVAYQAAVQHPATAFADQELRASTVTTGTLGLPRAVAGNFAVTYQLRAGGRQWAVRCFHREAADRALRYAAISRLLAPLRSGPLVPIDYLDQGVRVGTAWYPITKMAWIDGFPLNRAVEASLSKPAALRAFERNVVEIVRELRQRGIAHGDLQHGNILVDSNGCLRLVDYDGMFVPELRGRPANEAGDPNYQHPRRGSQFDAELDRFAALVIVVALRALAAAPRLWHAYNTGDNLLFRRADFADPGSSALFRELKTINEVAHLADRLAHAAQDDYAHVPLLDDLLRPPAASKPPRPVPIVEPKPLRPGHIAVLNSLYGAPSGTNRRRAAQNVRSWKLRRTTPQEAVAFSHDGVLLASAEGSGRITLRDAGSGKTERSVRLPASVKSLAFTPGGRLLAATLDGSTLAVWDALEQKRLHHIECNGRPRRAAALSTNGRWLVASSGDVLHCWSIGSDARLVATLRYRRSVAAVAVSDDGRYLASAGGSHLRVALRKGEIVGQTRAGAAIAFCGAEVLIGNVHGGITQWDPLSGEVLDLADLDGTPRAVALSRDGCALAAAASDGTVWLRRLAVRAVRQSDSSTAATRLLSSSQRLFDWLRRVALLL